MNKITKFLLLCLVAIMALPASAQQRRISGTVSDDFDVIIGANVVEKDKNNRIVSQARTDMNGNFTMNIKDPNNTITITYIGYKPFAQKIGTRTVFKVTLQDNTKVLKEAVVTAPKKAPTTGLDIPAREYAGAVQKFNMDELEGLSFESVDQALQGQIAGLDIVQNSGNLGSGTTMRLRGISTISGNANPLIVVDDHIFELPDDKKDDFRPEEMDNEEQFSTLLNVNPEDIESITVLKDAASAAKWGAKGSNGVIEIKLRRGSRGPTRVNFSYKFDGTWQPEGYKMLTGDGYSMMLKEAYFNPHQNTDESDKILEVAYPFGKPGILHHFSESNTDWINKMKKFGQQHKWYVTVSGGGEKATFRVSAGYDHATGSVVGQKLDRFSTVSNLDYWVSDRIKFQSRINMTFTNNHKNYGGANPLDWAYKAMPNMSVYEYDELGNRTNNYFNMYPIAAELSTGSIKELPSDDYLTSYHLLDMFQNGNPMARAQLAWRKQNQYNLTPQFSIEYKLLGKDDDHHRLNYMGDVQLNIYNTSEDEFCPSELRTMSWVWGGDNTAAGVGANNRNLVSNSEYKSLEFTTRHELKYYSAFKNKDHNLSALARFEMAVGNSSSQNIGLWNAPDGITDPTVVALLNAASASNNQWRSHSFYEMVHYSYKSKYSLDASLRTDGSTALGRDYKYANFPSVGARWNISDEDFMKGVRKVINMLAFRPTWGYTGFINGGGNQFNKYGTNGYYNGHQVVTPDNLSLTQLRWEKKMTWNLGFNLGLWDDLLTFELEVYGSKITDMVMTSGLRIPSANGFGRLSAVNAGVMTNKGWELNASTGKIAKTGKFSMKLRANIAQNFNEVEEMNPLILEELNGSDTWQPTNYDYTKRVQIGNALGSIYGLKYKGVYRYDYEHNGYTEASWQAYGRYEIDKRTQQPATDREAARLHGTGYDVPDEVLATMSSKDRKKHEVNTSSAARNRGHVDTCPLAYDAAGNLLTDSKGTPLPLYYCYNETSRYQFEGGDAIYEDINHDGQIDRYDMVYLGNSNPKCNGGFGITLFYDRFSINTGFNFRFGNDIINVARMEYESMLNNNNQSFATTWRWRKNGDGENQSQIVPRAMSGAIRKTYNSLPSDRYVENGDFLRMNYIQLKYDFDTKLVKKIGLRSLNLSATINNLFCLTKYTGVDPEISPSYLGVAIDNMKTPRSKSFTCSVNVGF